MILYHYTSAHHLPSILTDGKIRASESNVGSTWRDRGFPYGADAAPRVVWLMDTPDPDPYNHGLEGASVDKREVRIAVETTCAVPWLTWSHASRMSSTWRSNFIAYGGGLEAAKHWYVIPADLRKRLWREVAVRDYSTGEYVPVPEETFATT